LKSDFRNSARAKPFDITLAFENVVASTVLQSQLGEVDYALERNVVLMQLPGREDTGTACVIRGRRGYSREIPVQQEKFSY
jgi:hypothetical protein